MVDKNNHFMSEEQMSDLIKDTPQVSDDMIFRHTLKKDFSNYRSNIIVQNGNSEASVKAAQSLANKHPESSIIVHFDDNNKLVTFLMMYLSTLANFLYYLLCHSVKNQTEILMASYYLMDL
jgi:hypothetical protein